MLYFSPTRVASDLLTLFLVWPFAVPTLLPLRLWIDLQKWARVRLCWD
jgi:hypothetical protein